ncbi:cytochrome P450 [Saccharothrix longispora]|uniref:Cytochrome P450 n=1 Tax=Saccharothrix longispora TaxID=33920 RepID=A0ABU1Q146_9PSEU|nr:cytochrome P450 [Saccharothrix longispora]MDR6596391.1 cytochrome P450 [Saccharothrix longispora]
MAVPVAPGRLPLLGHSLEMPRKRHAFTSSLRDHGEVVREDLGTVRTYFVTSPRLAHQVLVTDGARFRKGAVFDTFQPYLGNGLLLSNGPFHLRQRRLVQPAFHRERLERHAGVMAAAVVGEALFSTELGAAAVAVPRGGFIPFGAGARQCLGNAFARTEVVITLATVLARWRLAPVPGRPVRTRFTSAAYPSGLLMTAVPR